MLAAALSQRSNKQHPGTHSVMSAPKAALLTTYASRHMFQLSHTQKACCLQCSCLLNQSIILHEPSQGDRGVKRHRFWMVLPAVALSGQNQLQDNQTMSACGTVYCKGKATFR